MAAHHSLSKISTLFVLCLLSPPSYPFQFFHSLQISVDLQLIQNRKMMASLPLTSLNHISLVCRSVEESLDFYQNVLGFSPIRRPGSFDFDGAWLFNYGIGIHLLQSEDPSSLPFKAEINPKDNHISFQCESLSMVEKKLKEMEICYVQRRVEEVGIFVDQIFFHDPDGFMIEICNCENIPVIPLPAGESAARVCKRVGCLIKQQQQQQCLSPAIHTSAVLNFSV